MNENNANYDMYMYCLLLIPLHVLVLILTSKKSYIRTLITLSNADEWKLYLVQNRCIDKLLEIKDLRLIKKVMDIIILIVAEG